MPCARASRQYRLLLAKPQIQRQLHQLHRLHPNIITRPSLRPATRTFVWMSQAVMRAMDSSCGCGSVTERNHSGGGMTTGRFAMLQTRRNALMRETCRMDCSCTCGTAMVNLSRLGVMIPMGLNRIWLIPAPVWTTMATGRRTDSPFTCGSAPVIGTSSGHFGIRPHCQLFELL